MLEDTPGVAQRLGDGMDSQPSGKNDPCPCGSGKKFRQCCWLKRLQTAGPATVAHATRFGSARVGHDSFGYVPPGPQRSPLSPDLVVKVFLPERRDWVDSRLAD